MSSFVHAIVVRLPLNHEILQTLNMDIGNYFFEIDDYLHKINRENIKENDFLKTKKNYFELATTDVTDYIDYVLRSSYGEITGSFGHSRYLTKDEEDKYKKIFDRLKIPYDVKNLRVVEYCYYNCSECKDYYDVKYDIKEE